MIPGLHKAALKAVYILAAAAGMCRAPAPPTVHMDFVDTPPIQRNDLSSRQLGSFQISTTFSHSRNEIFTVGGLTLSDFSPEYLIDFDAIPDDISGWPCLSVKAINITVKYAPTIYVASDFKPGTCRFDSTLQHEARHVNTDIITFNELLPVLRQAVQDAADQLGATGPVKPDDVVAARDKMVDRLKGALVAKADEIEKIRFSRQQMIDTRQEYLRMTKLCADEPLAVPGQ